MSTPFEQLARGSAQRVAHYGVTPWGEVIGNTYDVATDGVDALTYRNRVFGPIDPMSLNGYASAENLLFKGQVFWRRPASYAEVTPYGAYATGGAEAYLWNNRNGNSYKVLFDYDGEALYNGGMPV